MATPKSRVDAIEQYIHRKATNVVFVYEVAQIELLPHFLDKHSAIRDEGVMLVALDREIEFLLDRKGVPYISAKQYRSKEWLPLVEAENWLEKLFDDSWSFFTYRGVSLSRLYFFPLQEYLAQVFYWADCIHTVAAELVHARRFIALPSTKELPMSTRTLVPNQLTLVQDVVRLVATSHDKEALVPQKRFKMRIFRRSVFVFNRTVFNVAVMVLNVLVRFAASPRTVRILVSDYWKNIAPYVEKLPTAEVVLLDRTELFTIKLSKAWQHRMRFVQISSFSAGGAKKRLQAFRILQNNYEARQMPHLIVNGIVYDSLYKRAFKRILDEIGSKILQDIDRTHSLLTKLRPNVIELRSTMSAQTHFVILAQVGKTLGIPSLELQHGLEYYGPGSMDRRHSSGYIGVYGPLTKSELEHSGDTITPVVIGSPRFDIYTNSTRMPSDEHTTIMCIAPAVSVGIADDTWDIEDFFVALARSMPVGTKLLIKMRSLSERPDYYREVFNRVFADKVFEITAASLAKSLPGADIAVSCYSTALLEAMQAHVPVVYLALSKSQRLMGQYFEPYLAAGALKIVTVPELLAEALRELLDAENRAHIKNAADEFLSKSYAFDGKASDRTAALIMDLAKDTYTSIINHHGQEIPN